MTDVREIRPIIQRTIAVDAYLEGLELTFGKASRLKERLELRYKDMMFDVIPCDIAERYEVKRIRFDEPEMTGTFDLSEFRGM